MAKAKFDFKSIEIPTAAQKPLYAGVGAGDLAVTAVMEYVADVQKRITDVQKTVTDFDAKKARKTGRRRRHGSPHRRRGPRVRPPDGRPRAPDPRADAVNDNVAVATATYTDLAKRGEALVRGTKLPSSASAEVKVNPTHPARARRPTPAPRAGTTKKAAAKKAPAKKTTAKKAHHEGQRPTKA